MAGGFGGTIKLKGESEYRKALSEITGNLRLLGSEMKVVSSKYDENDKSSKKLKESKVVLNKQIQEQKEKVEVLKKALADAEKETGKTSNTTKKWQIELNKAEADLNKLNRELDETPKKTKNANEGFTVFKGILANLGSEAIMGVLNGVKELGSAVVDLGKQAVESFAEYQQLIGGVETLFKDSAGIVQEYANIAYKTAGISANEYMSTVTSFSASLLQSLDGDTKKASEYSNRAIIDMSDNANKMGTDMASLQNAYQGFAKQNYTMLDNLKLGYGGTKEEMARLIKDASELEEEQKKLGITVDGSSMSFDNIVNAISVMQSKMDIAGTTSKEASTTITGSVNSMKSAWENLLTGIADKNADLPALISNFVDSILTVGDNLLPIIQTVIQGMGELVSGLLTELVPEIINVIPPLIESTLPTLITAVQTAITSIVAVFPQIATSLSEMLPMIIGAIAEMLPMIVDAAIQIVLALVNGLSQSLPTLIPVVIDALLTIVDNLISNIDLIIDAGINLILGLAEGLINAIPVLVEKIPVIIENIISAIYRNQAKIYSAGIQLIIQLGLGLIKAIPDLVFLIPEIIKSMVNGFIDGIGDMISVGKDLLSGLIKGLTDWDAIYKAIKGVGQGFIDGFKSFFGIHSPSTVMADGIGKNLALGLGVGFEDTMEDVSDQMAHAVPTNLDVETSISANGSQGNGLTIEKLTGALKEALREVKIVLDDEVAGEFVTATVERVVYS